MKGFRRHIAASIAITSVFLVCAIAIGMGAAPARAPEQVVEQPEVLKSSVAAAPIQSVVADALEVPTQTVTDATPAASDASPVEPAVSQPAAAPQVPAQPDPQAAPDAPADPEVTPAVAPNPPRNLVGTFVATGPNVHLTWSAPSGGSRVRTYRIYREEVGGLVPMALAPLEETSNRNYNDYAIADDTLYHYWVTGVNRQGEEGSPSNIVEVQTYSNKPPAPPQGVAAYAIDPGVSLDWLPNTDKNLAGYNVYEWRNNRWRKRNSSLLADNHFYYSSGAAASTYAISAVNFSGIESAYTSVVPVQTTPVIYEESDSSISVSGLWAIEHYTGQPQLQVHGQPGEVGRRSLPELRFGQYLP
jgi:hypothetical protein